MINTPTGSGARADGYEIRTAAVRHGHPLRDDDDRRLGRGAGDRRRQRDERRSRAPSRRSTRAPQRGRRARRALSRAVRAPALRGRREPRLGRLPGLLAARREGPEPGAGPVLHARRRRAAGSSAAAAPFLPRALSVAETAPAAGGVRLDFLIEAVGPGTERLCALEPGEEVWVTGPLGNAFSDAARAHARRRRGDPGRRRDRHRAAGAAAPPLRRARRPDPRPARLPRRGPLRRPRRPLRLLRGPPRQRGRPRSATAATSPTCSRRCSTGDDAASAVVYSCGPPAMLEAVRRDLRRARRRLRAGAGVADGLRLRRLLRLRRAEAGRRLHAPLRRRPGRPRREIETALVGEPALMAPTRDAVDLCGIELGAPGHQRLRDLRRDRRPPRLRRRAARATSPSPPSSRRRSRRSRGPATRRSGSGRRRRG